MNETTEQTRHDFANGDAVIASDGDFQVMGVVHEVYDDVVEVEYLDEFGLMDTIEFHASEVKPVAS